MAITLHETTNSAVFSGSQTSIGLVLGVLQGDMLFVGADTNNGAQVSSVFVGAKFTASIGNNSNLLVVSAAAIGTILPGQLLTDGGVHIPQGVTVLSQSSGPTGGAGTYVVSHTFSPAVASEGMQTTDPRVGALFTASVQGTKLIVTAVAGGFIGVGQLVVDTGNAIIAGTTITGGPASGGVGTYILSADQGVIASTTMQAVGFTKLGQGFSLSVWTAGCTANLGAYPPAQPIVLVYGTSYNTTSIIGANYRGATAIAPFDPNVSMPSIQTGNPAPSPATFSTTLAHDKILFWIGCFVGFAGVAPWTNPAVSGVNTVTIAGSAGNWVNGLNNTELLAPIAITLYDLDVSTVQSSVTASTSATMSGAAYLVVALTSDELPGVPGGQACGTNSTTSVTFMWSAPSSGSAPTSYTVQYRVTGTSTWTTVTGINATSLNVTGLSPGTSYEWQVEAVNSQGTGGFSASFFCGTVGAQFSTADVYFTPSAAFVDLTQAANRRKFITGTGGAVYLASDGSSPLGVQPSVFLTVTAAGTAGSADTFASNNGKGGAFAITAGPLTLSASSPPGSVGTAGGNGPNVVGDYRNGNLYTFNLDQPLDNGQIRRWLRSWLGLGNRISSQPRRFDQLTIDMETGSLS